VPHDRSVLERLAVPLLIAVGLGLHLPWLMAPFGFHDINAGGYFGPFAQSWHRFGFFELRGVPLGAWILTIPMSPAEGLPYWNHPPGFAWVTGAFGSAEWQLRLASLLGVIASGPLMFAFARRHLGSAAAFIAGLLVLAAPTVAFYSVMSYESLVLSLGLAMWLLHERVGRGGGTATRLGVLVVCFVGTWMDWAFGFYVLALLPLSLPAGFADLARRLWRPWLVYFVALLLIVLWIWWSKQAAGLPPPRAGATLADRAGHAVFGGPPPAVFFANLGRTLCEAFTLPVLIVAAVGAVPALWKMPRIMLTALLPAVLNIGIFRAHSANHVMFVAYLAPAVALAAACLLQQLGRLRPMRPPVVLAAVALVMTMVWHSWERKRGASQPLMARFGTAVSEIADAPSPDADTRSVLVATNVPQYYPYYISSPRVLLTPVLSHAELERQRGAAARLRYVYVQSEVRMVGEPPVAPPDEPLRAWLQQFPRHELPQLVGDWPLGHGDVFSVLGAWVYDL